MGFANVATTVSQYYFQLEISKFELDALFCYTNFSGVGKHFSNIGNL